MDEEIDRSDRKRKGGNVAVECQVPGDYGGVQPSLEHPLSQP